MDAQLSLMELIKLYEIERERKKKVVISVATMHGNEAAATLQLATDAANRFAVSSCAGTQQLAWLSSSTS